MDDCIEAIRAREHAATPGPWYSMHDNAHWYLGAEASSHVFMPMLDGHGEFMAVRGADPVLIKALKVAGEDTFPNPFDEDFLQGAREDVPTLLEALDRSTHDHARLQAKHCRTKALMCRLLAHCFESGAAYGSLELQGLLDEAVRLEDSP